MTAGLGAAFAPVLAALSGAATPPPGPVDIPRDPAADLAREELSKPIYHQDDPSLIQRVLNWLMDRFSELLDRASNLAPGGPFGLIVLALVLLAVVIAVRMRLGPLRVARRAAARRGLFAGEGPRTADEYRRLADAHAARGDWDAAVQDRLRAVVRALEERAILDERAGRTADEAAAEAGIHLPQLADPLQAAAVMFDDVRYGAHPATADMDAALRDLDTRCAAARPAAEPVAAAPDRTPR
ncbi:DUF4129 domain-containing protein [Yinghuangia seranimata]|uniref:DUF4129 domain-containing protein n=1 Tax=Yinghuangia seranimata TaxID=408067 RepID=UPI00248D2436|nr:DUF4129 domain-containing protein [Yinghuangia seranimata]MDI2131445.1 DUF4129 domain-containing protein [Yinghuangia seranimata]